MAASDLWTQHAAAISIGALVVGIGCADGNDPPPTGGGGQNAGGAPQGGEPATGGAPGGGGTSNDGGAGATGGEGGVPSSGGSGGAGDCGDGTVDAGEDCDTVPGVSCVDLGYVSGITACTSECTFDVSGCSACFDHQIQPELGEDCDFDLQGDPLVLATCASLGFLNSGANPGCDDDCHYDIKICLCGDDQLDVLEDCDGELFDGQTCMSLGYTTGMLVCSPDCEIDTSGCSLCGNGAVEGIEQCDDGNAASGDGCSATCETEVVACDPDGTYLKNGGAISYTCCSGLIGVNVNQFLFTSNGAAIATSPSNPATMTGSPTTCPSGSFQNTASIPGGCTETYSLTGSFTDVDTWTGTYSLQFTGPDCSCFGGMFGTPCINQTFPVTAVRQ